jgi:hypothetical protein
MERSEALRALHDIAVQIRHSSAKGPALSAQAQARSARTPSLTTSAVVTDAKQLLAGSGDDHHKDPGPVSERRDRTNIRWRRSEDRKAFAPAGMYDEFDQRHQEYQTWVRKWTDNGIASGQTG